jgi:hypothetical protein
MCFFGLHGSHCPPPHAGLAARTRPLLTGLFRAQAPAAGRRGRAAADYGVAGTNWYPSSVALRASPLSRRARYASSAAAISWRT